MQIVALTDMTTFKRIAMKMESDNGEKIQASLRSPSSESKESLAEEVTRWRGVPKTPQGWQLGLTVMAILIAAPFR